MYPFSQTSILLNEIIEVRGKSLKAVKGIDYKADSLSR